MNTPTFLRVPVGNQARSRKVWRYAALLLLLLVVQSVMSMREKSATLEEIMSITAGYYRLRTGSSHLDRAQPPLMNMISAAPLILLNAELPKVDGDPGSWSRFEQTMYASTFVYDNRLDAQQMIFITRLPVIGIAVLAAVSLFLWIRDLYGDKAGIVALFVYVLGSNFLGPASLTANDFGAGAFLLIAALLFWRNSQEPSVPALLGCAAAFLAAALTKVSAILFLPLAGVLTTVLLWRRRLGSWERVGFVHRIDSSRVRAKQAASAGITFAVLLLAVVGAVNASYLFEGSFDPMRLYDADPEISRLLPAGTAVSRLITDVYLNTPVPFPRPFVEQVKQERQPITVRQLYPASLDHVLVRLGNGHRYLAYSHLKLRSDLVYRVVHGKALKLDLYAPQGGKPPYPTMIYFHGGGWGSGSKESASFIVVPYLARGMAVVSVQYRLASNSPAPAAVEDCRCALRWVFDNAERHGLDVSRLAVSGISAGGHLALMTGMLDSSHGYDDACAAGPAMKVSAIVNFYGATDLGDRPARAPLKKDIVRWLGDVPDPEALAREMSPLSYVRDGLPPILTIHGDADPIVPFEYAARLHQALEEKNSPNELLTIPGGKHGIFSAEETVHIDETIEAFLRKHGVLP